MLRNGVFAGVCMPIHPIPLDSLRYQPVDWATYSKDYVNALRHGLVHWNERLLVVEFFQKELTAYSGKHFKIAIDPYRGDWAQYNQVFLQITLLGHSDLVIGFILAHEWAHLCHEDLHSKRDIVPRPIQEQQADIFAAQFMRNRGFSIVPALDYFRRLPPVPEGELTHGHPQDRLLWIAKAYNGTLTVFPEEQQPDYERPPTPPLIPPVKPWLVRSQSVLPTTVTDAPEQRERAFSSPFP